jgi:hypothetical protein
MLERSCTSRVTTDSCVGLEDLLWILNVEKGAGLEMLTQRQEAGRNFFSWLFLRLTHVVESSSRIQQDPFVLEISFAIHNITLHV